MNTTWYEKGLEKGREEMNTTVYEKGLQMGREEASRAILRDLLEERFGPLPVPVQERLQQLTADRLAALTKAVLRAQSLRELGLED